jgi:peptide/nickel transport system substrate-binding protein
LRSGVKFSDGTPLTAEDVVFSMTRAIDQKSSWGFLFSPVKSVEKVDDHTVRFTMSDPFAPLLPALSTFAASIYSKANFEKYGDQAGNHPLGTAAFMLDHWTQGQEVVLVKNPNYWQEGKPYLDEFVVLTGMADAAPKFEAVTSGRAQLALEPLGVNVGKYRRQPERYAVMSTPEAGGGVALALNLARPPFDDLRLRRALALVLDSADYVDLAGYDDPTMVMTTLDRAGTRWCDPALRLPARDVATAQKLVDGIAAERGGPVRFTIETFENEGHIREARVVKQIVEACLTNIEVDVSIGTVADVMGKWRSGDWHASNHAVRWSDPALDLPASFASTSPANIMGYRDAEVDAALERLGSATDESEAVAAHQAVLRRVLGDLPVVFLSHKEAFHIVDREKARDWKLFYSLRPLIEEAWAAS